MTKLKCMYCGNEIIIETVYTDENGGGKYVLCKCESRNYLDVDDEYFFYS